MAASIRLLRSFTAASAASISDLSAIRAFTTMTTDAISLFTPILMKRDLKDRGVRWVFLGCPGVGKGTYASRLSQLLDVPHIGTGDLVRDELDSSGNLGQELAAIVNKGGLVPDETIVSLLSKRLESGAAKGESGFILDGFPRTIKQASQPVEEFYRSQGKLLEFHLPGGIPESWPKLLQALNLDYPHENQSAAA